MFKKINLVFKMLRVLWQLNVVIDAFIDAFRLVRKLRAEYVNNKTFYRMNELMVYIAEHLAKITEMLGDKDRNTRLYKIMS